MLIYNITIQVESSIYEAWMLDIHILKVFGTGCFKKHQFVRLLEIDKTQGPTYAIQHYTYDKTNYHRYLQEYRQL